VPGFLRNQSTGKFKKGAETCVVFSAPALPALFCESKADKFKSGERPTQALASAVPGLAIEDKKRSPEKVIATRASIHGEVTSIPVRF
jgi:hypothetical protein